MILNTNAGSRTNRNILRRGGTIPDPWRTILYRRNAGLGGRGSNSLASKVYRIQAVPQESISLAGIYFLDYKQTNLTLINYRRNNINCNIDM